MKTDFAPSREVPGVVPCSSETKPGSIARPRRSATPLPETEKYAPPTSEVDEAIAKRGEDVACPTAPEMERFAYGELVPSPNLLLVSSQKKFAGEADCERVPSVEL